MRRSALTIRYTANTLNGRLLLPENYVDRCTAENLAELAATTHWQDHPHDTPTLVTVVHLRDVAGKDLGLFDVRCEQRLIFTAHALRQG